MKSVGKHSCWSAFLFLDKMHCANGANGVASFGVSVLSELGVFGVMAFHESSQLSSAH